MNDWEENINKTVNNTKLFPIMNKENKKLIGGFYQWANDWNDGKDINSQPKKFIKNFNNKLDTYKQILKILHPNYINDDFYKSYKKINKLKTIDVNNMSKIDNFMNMLQSKQGKSVIGLTKENEYYNFDDIINAYGSCNSNASSMSFTLHLLCNESAYNKFIKLCQHISKNLNKYNSLKSGIVGGKTDNTNKIDSINKIGSTNKISSTNKTDDMLNKFFIFTTYPDRYIFLYERYSPDIESYGELFNEKLTELQYMFENNDFNNFFKFFDIFYLIIKPVIRYFIICNFVISYDETNKAAIEFKGADMQTVNNKNIHLLNYEKNSLQNKSTGQVISISYYLSLLLSLLFIVINDEEHQKEDIYLYFLTIIEEFKTFIDNISDILNTKSANINKNNNVIINMIKQLNIEENDKQFIIRECMTNNLNSINDLLNNIEKKYSNTKFVNWRHIYKRIISGETFKTNYIIKCIEDNLKDVKKENKQRKILFINKCLDKLKLHKEESIKLSGEIQPMIFVEDMVSNLKYDYIIYQKNNKYNGYYDLPSIIYHTIKILNYVLYMDQEIAKEFRKIRLFIHFIDKIDLTLVQQINIPNNLINNIILIKNIEFMNHSGISGILNDQSKIFYEIVMQIQNEQSDNYEKMARIIQIIKEKYDITNQSFINEITKKYIYYSICPLFKYDYTYNSINIELTSLYKHFGYSNFIQLLRDSDAIDIKQGDTMIIGYPNRCKPNENILIDTKPQIIQDSIYIKDCILYYPSIYKTEDVYDFDKMKKFLLNFKKFTIILYAYADHVKFWFRL